MADIPNEGYYRRLLNAIMSGEEVPDWSGRPTAAERDLYSDWLSPAERLRRQADKMRAWERGSLRSFEPPAPDQRLGRVCCVFHGWIRHLRKLDAERLRSITR